MREHPNPICTRSSLWVMLVLAVASLTGCQQTPGAAPMASAKIDVAYPSLVIEVDKHPDALVSDFARARIAGLIGERLRMSPNNPFQTVSEVRPEDILEPQSVLIARLTLTRYDHFGRTWMNAIDPLYRMKISGVLDLVDHQSGSILASRNVVRVISLDTFGELSGFNDSRSPLRERRHVHIHRLDHSRSKARLLERAFTSAVVRDILTLVPGPGNSPEISSITKG